MLKDGDAQTACQTACSADAIVFGNVKDKDSAINKVRAENKQRTFEVLEQIHVLPNITYLAKVRNTDEIIESEHGEEKKEAGHGEATMPAATKPEEASH